MYPDPLPRDVLEDPRRGAEIKLYQAFAALDDPGLHVFYGVAWLERHGRKMQEGESDFIVAHPDWGILMVEVKGGRIARSTNGQWTSTDRHNVVHHINDPEEQARRWKHDLQRKLASHPGWGSHGFNIGHAVAFPDCVFPKAGIGTALRRDIVFDLEDLDNLGYALERTWFFWRNLDNYRAEMGHDRVSIATQLLAPTFELLTPLRRTFASEEQEITRLTEEQFRILDMMKRCRRLAITGRAGTGKTVLALEKARRLARDGCRTLLTCFNRNLAEHLRELAPEPNLIIRTYHHLCAELAEHAGVYLPAESPEDPEASRQYWNSEHTKVLLEALPRLSDDHLFDAIVADEAQDFQKSWLEAIVQTLRCPDDGIAYIFYDDMQGLFRPVPRVYEIQQGPELLDNLRNAQPIHDLVRQRYNLETAGKGPIGQPVEWMIAGDDDTAALLTAERIRRLVEVEAVAPGQIAILTGRNADKGPLSRPGLFGDIPLSWKRNDPEAITIATIHSFKGLERSCILLVDIDTQIEKHYEQAIYVGLTRAQSWLAIVGKPETITSLRDGIAMGI